MSRRLWCIMVLGMLCVVLSAQTVSLSLHDVPLSEALRQIDQGQQSRRIVFVFNEMERFHVTCQIVALEPLEAVRQVCASLPIRIKSRGKHIFVEVEPSPVVKPSPPPPSPHQPLSEVRMLSEVTVLRKRICYGANGYTAQLEAHAMSAAQALTYLPNLMRRLDHLYVHGQEVTQVFVDGIPLVSLNELDQLQGDMIREVRIDYQPCVIHIALRQPDQGGYYGSAHSELIGQGARNDHAQLGAVGYMRHRGLCLFNRIAFEGSHLTELVRNAYHLPDAHIVYDGERQQQHRQFSDRFSIHHEFNPHHALGASLYLAYDWGKASSVMQRDRDYYFDGDNRHTDTELTLRYTHTFGPRHGTLEAMLDVFDRSAQTENLSLYGAGVGTELGESPSITLWRGSIDVHQPLADQTTLLYRLDMRSFHSLYDQDPERYHSNFIGIPAAALRLDQYGQMLDAGVDLQHAWHRLQLSAGMGIKANRVDNRHQGHYTQRSLTPHLRLEFPLGTDADRHRLALSAQRQLDDIPYAALSPAIRWNDAFNFTLGNTTLHAPVSTQLMLNASLCRGLFNLTTTYSSVRHEIYWQTTIARGQTDIFYTQPVNLDHLRTISLQGELNLHPTPWWQAKVAAHLVYRIEGATLADTRYADSHLHQHYTLDHHLHFSTHWSATLHADYQPRHRIYDRTYHSTYLVSGEVQRTWFGDRLQTSLLFVPAGRNRQIDRLIEQRPIVYHYRTSLQQLGIRLVWHFSSGRRIKVGTIEGGQRFEENKSDL